jgi:hypothetical protein
MRATERLTVAGGMRVEGRDNDAAPDAVRSAVRSAVRDGRVTMGTTGDRAQSSGTAKRDTLRSLQAGAIWTALPARDQHLLLWLLGADIVTAQLAALLVYGQLRIAQRRLSRLAEHGLLRGFWAAGAQRPRGRHAYILTRAARLQIERLAWPEGRSDRPPELAPSAPIHQLATHDLFAAFLRAGNPAAREGPAVWVPERACGLLFGGFLRPDALAGIRVGDRALTLFIERDLGTERGEALADKVRRYRSVFASIPNSAAHVGFVVESARRGQTIIESVIRRSGASAPFLTAISQRVEADPLGAGWFDGEAERSTRELATASLPDDWLILSPGCLADADAVEALDDRGATLLPAIRPFLQSS